MGPAPPHLPPSAPWVLPGPGCDAGKLLHILALSSPPCESSPACFIARWRHSWAGTGDLSPPINALNDTPIHGHHLPVHLPLRLHIFPTGSKAVLAATMLGAVKCESAPLNDRQVGSRMAETDRRGRAEAAAVKGSLQYFCQLLLTRHRGEYGWLLEKSCSRLGWVSLSALMRL